MKWSTGVRVEVVDPEVALFDGRLELGDRGSVIALPFAQGYSEDAISVLWDNGGIYPVLTRFVAEEQVVKRASTLLKQASKIKISSSDWFEHLSALFVEATAGIGGGDLIHKATQDYWSFKQDDDGVTLTRLFPDTGPLAEG